VSDVIPGVAEAVAIWSSRIAIGSTTGYSREMLDVVVAKAKAQGYDLIARSRPRRPAADDRIHT
jgi:beta-phosphoglucomutase-like phosphatase (HAD superfamily)